MIRFSPLVVAALLLADAASAQQPGGMGMGMGMGAAMDIRFNEIVPGIGEQIPDVTIIDDQGNPVSMRELVSGHYSVVTLGCLT